jgi:hypothetical protein
MTYINPILEIDVGHMNLKIEERPIGHRLFLPQEVVRWEVWTRGCPTNFDNREKMSRS